MVICYLDESGTDNNCETVVVGGVVLEMWQCFWLDIEWRKTLEAHNVPWPVHMKDFGRHGRLRRSKTKERRAFFRDLVRVLNDHKGMSIACRFASEQYRRTFENVSLFSMYGGAFLNVAMTNSHGAARSGYRDQVK